MYPKYLFETFWANLKSSSIQVKLTLASFSVTFEKYRLLFILTDWSHRLNCKNSEPIEELKSDTSGVECKTFQKFSPANSV